MSEKEWETGINERAGQISLREAEKIRKIKEPLLKEIADFKAKLSKAEAELKQEREAHELTKDMYDGITEAGIEKASAHQDVMKYKEQRDEARAERDEALDKATEFERTAKSLAGSVFKLEAERDSYKQRLEGLQGAVEYQAGDLNAYKAFEENCHNDNYKVIIDSAQHELRKAYEVSKEKP